MEGAVCIGGYLKTAGLSAPAGLLCTILLSTRVEKVSGGDAEEPELDDVEHDPYPLLILESRGLRTGTGAIAGAGAICVINSGRFPSRRGLNAG